MDCLTRDGVIQYLDNKQTKLNILETVDSTNLYMKRIADSADDGAVIIAKSQTGGRGRFLRKFHSPKNSGIYMSIFLRPLLPATDAVLITTAAAVAVSEACECLGAKKCTIKWVNDVLIGSRKICGILTEGSINPNTARLDYAILGVGINVYEPDGEFDDEIKDIAGFVFEKSEEQLTNRLAAEIINRFNRYYTSINNKSFLKSYRERSCIIGKEINVIKGGDCKPAIALDIDDSCRLLVEYKDKTREYLSSGEVSVKIT